MSGQNSFTTLKKASVRVGLPTSGQSWSRCDDADLHYILLDGYRSLLAWHKGPCSSCLAQVITNQMMKMPPLRKQSKRYSEIGVAFSGQSHGFAGGELTPDAFQALVREQPGHLQRVQHEHQAKRTTIRSLWSHGESSFFSLLGEVSGKNTTLASQPMLSWNQIQVWLQKLDCLRDGNAGARYARVAPKMLRVSYNPLIHTIKLTLIERVTSNLKSGPSRPAPLVGQVNAGG